MRGGFFLCTVILLYILKTKVAPDFLGAYHVLFSLSKLFYVDSFMLV